MKKLIFNNRGMSDVVSNVMMILLAIAIVFLVGFFVYELVFAGFIDLDSLDLKFNKIEVFYNNNSLGSSNLNQQRTFETIYVRVGRGEDTTNLSGLNFVFLVEGESYSCRRSYVPVSSQTVVYAFQSPKFADSVPESIELIPIIRDSDGDERIARSGFIIEEVFVTSDVLQEKVNECGGFCCDDSYPDVPADLTGI